MAATAAAVEGDETRLRGGFAKSSAGKAKGEIVGIRGGK
jgi:hypothetical protein